MSALAYVSRCVFLTAAALLLFAVSVLAQADPLSSWNDRSFRTRPCQPAPAFS